ncbi:MAG: glycosyltransferase family 39 protein [Nanoarchaeota archaeon]|nr:glycosyltransferase family 39 protein [Nanoarchaeota archaeon]
MKKEFLLLLSLTIISIIIITPNTEWDEYVYLLNAEHFAGNQLYFEDIRPPLFPLILAITPAGMQFVIPLIFFSAYLILSYFLAKEFEIKNPLTVVFILLSCPIVLMYAEKYMTSIPASCFLITSLLFMKKHIKSNNNFFLYFSFLSAALTTLTRYVLGLIYPLLIILYFLFAKKKNYKELIISQLFFIIPIIVWVNYIGIESFYYAYLWGGGASNPLTYLLNIPMILGLTFTLLFFTRLSFSKKDSWFLFPLLALIFFFQIFSNKQPRFLIPALPFYSIILTKYVNISAKKLLILLTLFVLVSALSAQYYYSLFCKTDMTDLTTYFSNKHVNILSNFWPICSYYTRNTCYALIEDFEDVASRAEYTNSTYIVVSNIYGKTYNNESFTHSGFIMNKLINEDCEQLLIYGKE